MATGAGGKFTPPSGPISRTMKSPCYATLPDSQIASRRRELFLVQRAHGALVFRAKSPCESNAGWIENNRAVHLDLAARTGNRICAGLQWMESFRSPERL